CGRLELRDARRAHPRYPDLQGIDRTDHGRGRGDHQKPSRRLAGGIRFQTEGKMDALPELLETIEDGIATLTFNRPERMNALSTPIMEGLLHGLPRLAGDPAVKVVILTGAGRAFCAGGDVKSMAEGGESRSAAE